MKTNSAVIDARMPHLSCIFCPSWKPGMSLQTTIYIHTYIQKYTNVGIFTNVGAHQNVAMYRSIYVPMKLVTLSFPRPDLVLA